jgi:hypothetical protein
MLRVTLVGAILAIALDENSETEIDRRHIFNDDGLFF